MFALLAMDEMIARLLLIYGFKVVQEIMKLAELRPRSGHCYRLPVL
jgi:hypothetical protein